MLFDESRKLIMSTFKDKQTLPVNLILPDGTRLRQDVLFLHHKDSSAAFEVMSEIGSAMFAVLLMDSVPGLSGETGGVVVIYNGYAEPVGEDVWIAIKNALHADDGTVFGEKYTDYTLTQLADEISLFAEEGDKAVFGNQLKTVIRRT